MNPSTGLLHQDTETEAGFRHRSPVILNIASPALGSWPAFWAVTTTDTNNACDEEDIIEGYGGNGGGQPNNGSLNYGVTSHEWNQDPNGISSGDEIY
jgi:hypothetical protein